MSLSISRALVVSVSALAFALTPLATPALGTGAALAAGNSGGHGNSGGGNSSDHGNSGGGGGSSDHGNSGGGNAGAAATTHGNSAKHTANTNGSAGNGASANGSPKAAVRQYVIANDLKQGEVARLLKSWNSLNRSEQAFLNNLDNPSSLAGKQAAYVCDNAKSQDALAAFTADGGNINLPPTAPTDTETAAYNDALQALAANDPPVSAADVLGAAPGTYPDALVTAANTVTDYESALSLYQSYQGYLDAKAAADDAFMAASVSYSKSTDPAKLQQLRDTVDGIVASKFADASSLCGTGSEGGTVALN